MRVIRKTIVPFLVLSCISCGNNDNGKLASDNSFSMNEDDKPISQLQNEVFKGNIDSYIRLRIVYLDNSPSDFMYWAMVMAHKNHYAPAYLDMYYCIYDSYPTGRKGFDSIDKETKTLLMHCLKQASKGGVTQADSILLKMRARP